MRYLAELCDCQLRGENVTSQLRNNAPKDKAVVLRTRNTSAGGRTAYAVVTPTYTAVDTDEVLARVSEDLADAHTEMIYDGSGARATALWMPDQVIDLAAGDVFKAGVRVQTDDTGRGRLRISAVVFRNRCLNLLVIGEGSVETVNQVHRGDRDRILPIIDQGVVRAREAIGKFLEAWGHARTVSMEPKVLFEEWLSSAKIVLPGSKTEETRRVYVDDLLAAWEKEREDTLAACVNAVSRYAHESPKLSFEVREDLERQAGRLVMAVA